MIGPLRILAVVPARGGSKRLPGKNIRPFAGAPLIAWTIRAARGSRYIDRLVVSSDDSGIQDVARAEGAETPFVRPERLASDEAATSEVLAHTLKMSPGFDGAVVLQPTSPLRSSEDIDRVLEALHDQGAEAAVTVAPVTKPLQWLLRRLPDGRLEPALHQPISQDGLCMPNGAVYAVRTEPFLRNLDFYPPGVLGVEMEPWRSIDIDTEEEFITAEVLALARCAGFKGSPRSVSLGRRPQSG